MEFIWFQVTDWKTWVVASAKCFSQDQGAKMGFVTRTNFMSAWFISSDRVLCSLTVACYSSFQSQFSEMNQICWVFPGVVWLRLHYCQAATSPFSSAAIGWITATCCLHTPLRQRIITSPEKVMFLFFSVCLSLLDFDEMSRRGQKWAREWSFKFGEWSGSPSGSRSSYIGFFIIGEISTS